MIYRGPKLLYSIYSGSVPLESSAEVYDAEIAAAVTGARAALLTAEAALSENSNIYLDNETAVIVLSEGCKNSSS